MFALKLLRKEDVSRVLLAVVVLCNALGATKSVTASSEWGIGHLAQNLRNGGYC